MIFIFPSLLVIARLSSVCSLTAQDVQRLSAVLSGEVAQVDWRCICAVDTFITYRVTLIM